MSFNWIVMFILFGIVQSVFVLTFFILKDKNKTYTYFICLLTILLILQIESFLVRSGLIKYVLHLFNFSIPLIFLIGPFLHEYVVSHIKKRSFKKRVLHLFPFVFYFSYSFNFFLQSAAYKYNIIANMFHQDWELLPVSQSFHVDPFGIQGYVVVEILTLHLLVYCFLSFFTLLKHKSRLNTRKLNWLIYISTIFTLGGLILFLSQGGIINGIIFFKTPFPHYSPDIFSTIGMYLIMGYFLIYPEFFTIKNKKYHKSVLSSDYKKEKLKKIMDLIENDRLYLNLNFSMKMLSEKSGLSVHHISQIFNEELNSTFFEICNTYRISEAKKRLKSSDDYIKMEQLAYEIGYKSKSTFYTAFKKETSVTPLQYKTSHA